MSLITNRDELPLGDALADLCKLHRELLQERFLSPRPNKTAIRKKLGLKRTKFEGVVYDAFDDAVSDALRALRESMRRRGIRAWADLPGEAEQGGILVGRIVDHLKESVTNHAPSSNS